MDNVKPERIDGFFPWSHRLGLYIGPGVNLHDACSQVLISKSFPFGAGLSLPHAQTISFDPISDDQMKWKPIHGKVMIYKPLVWCLYIRHDTDRHQNTIPPTSSECNEFRSTFGGYTRHLTGFIWTEVSQVRYQTLCPFNSKVKKKLHFFFFYKFKCLIYLIRRSVSRR